MAAAYITLEENRILVCEMYSNLFIAEWHRLISKAASLDDIPVEF